MKLLDLLKQKKEQYWIARGEKKALTLFHAMATRVPAYHDFLKKHKINHVQIRTVRDLQNVPTIDKNNYLRAYPLADLCWDGILGKKSWTIAATSGSTGEPFYFPRQKDQDLQYATTAEMYLLNNFQIDKKSTLYIDGFGMGIWIGGVFTYEAIRLVADGGKYPLSICTPGSSKGEIINAVTRLGKQFDQVIIAGYPPLVKDTIDEGEKLGINWKRYDLRFIFSAEGFSESFRDYIISHVGLKNPYKDTLNHYGTVDLGTMSHETPLTILVRRLAVKNKRLALDLFGKETRLPTLTQYMPEMFYFEQVGGELVCSALSGLPLVRYNLKDTGNILTLSDAAKVLKNHDIDLIKELQKARIGDTVCNLPFVYVFERSDFTVKLSGANIYPEEIRRALLKPPISRHLTGKFMMMVKFDANQNQYLEINCELQKGIKESKNLASQTSSSIVDELRNSNSEYGYLFTMLPKKRLVPRIVFWNYEDQTFFKPGGKQTWVKH